MNKNILTYFGSIPLGEVDVNIGSETYGDVFTKGLGLNSTMQEMI
jgi:hypothetical protein